MKPVDPAEVELESLVSLFFSDETEVGQFSAVSQEELTPADRHLLAHDHHMTVTVEEHYGCPVDVDVLMSRTDDQLYSRKILLTSRRDGAVVQFGIVRLNMAVLSDEVQREIKSQKTPLGRILIDHNVLRQVKLLGLYRIKSGTELAAHFGVEPGTIVHGRTAMIYCDGNPAIELLEVVHGDRN
ncbi:MAG: hypothetical protein AAFN77_17085 [Planctomycetota bacterium]